MINANKQRLLTAVLSDGVAGAVVTVLVVGAVSLVVAQPLPPLGTRLTAGSPLLVSLLRLGRLAGGRRADGTLPKLCIPCLRGTAFFCWCCSKDSPCFFFFYKHTLSLSSKTTIIKGLSMEWHYLTLLDLYKLLMSIDWYFVFPFSPFDTIPDRVDMLSAGNHLVLLRPLERTLCLEQTNKCNSAGWFTSQRLTEHIIPLQNSTQSRGGRGSIALAHVRTYFGTVIAYTPTRHFRQITKPWHTSIIHPRTNPTHTHHCNISEHTGPPR